MRPVGRVSRAPYTATMRPHAPLIAIVLAAAPLIGQAQILTRPLGGAKAAEFDRCMKAAGDDKAAARECVKASIDGQTSPPTEAQPPAVPTTAPPVETQPVQPTPTEPAPPTVPPTEEPTVPPTEPVVPPDAPQPTDVPPTPTEPGAGQGEQTQAERDYDAIYGQEYADPTLPTPVATPTR